MLVLYIKFNDGCLILCRPVDDEDDENDRDGDDVVVDGTGICYSSSEESDDEECDD